jgi:uncharacterized protein YegL
VHCSPLSQIAQDQEKINSTPDQMAQQLYQALKFVSNSVHDSSRKTLDNE